MLLSSTIVFADTTVEHRKLNRTVEEIKEDTQIIRYTVTIFKDSEEFNKNEWKNVVDQAALTIEELSAESLESSEELINTMFKSLQNVYKNGVNHQGIHGTLSISLGDGKCPKDGCNDPCACKAEYRGLCPCSLDITKSCKTYEGCPCTTKSEGCKCPEGSCCKADKGACCQ